jgi:RimJ/RimL family protein N-acetyltransferase
MGWVDTAKTVLENDHVQLRPIRPDDYEPVRVIAMDQGIWRYFVTAVGSDEDYDRYFAKELADLDAGRRVVYVITDKTSGRVAGSMSFGNLAEPDGRLEIGWSWLGGDFRGQGVNRWAKYLLLEHAFERMLVERVEFKTDKLNEQARRGLRNIGAVEEGILRSYNPMPDGRRRDAVFFSILRAEWPWVKEQLGSHPKVQSVAARP